MIARLVSRINVLNKLTGVGIRLYHRHYSGTFWILKKSSHWAPHLYWRASEHSKVTYLTEFRCFQQCVSPTCREYGVKKRTQGEERIGSFVTYKISPNQAKCQSLPTSRTTFEYLNSTTNTIGDFSSFSFQSRESKIPGLLFRRFGQSWGNSTRLQFQPWRTSFIWRFGILIRRSAWLTWE